MDTTIGQVFSPNSRRSRKQKQIIAKTIGERRLIRRCSLPYPNKMIINELYEAYPSIRMYLTSSPVCDIRPASNWIAMPPEAFNSRVSRISTNSMSRPLAFFHSTPLDISGVIPLLFTSSFRQKPESRHLNAQFKAAQVYRFFWNVPPINRQHHYVYIINMLAPNRTNPHCFGSRSERLHGWFDSMNKVYCKRVMHRKGSVKHDD